jgi:very-short-patch-repair endonuclease
MTSFEKKIWKLLGAEDNPYGFSRQIPICGYIVDFFAPKYNAIIEADGPEHFYSTTYDQTRDQILFQEKNIRTLRIRPIDLQIHTPLELCEWIDGFVRLGIQEQKELAEV